MNLRNLQFLFKPRYWLMNKPFNKEVDKIVTELLDKYELTNISFYGTTCNLGKATIWIENRPYASGTLYNTALENFRPSRLTIKRLLDRYYKLEVDRNHEIVKKIRSEFYLK